MTEGTPDEAAPDDTTTTGTTDEAAPAPSAPESESELGAEAGPPYGPGDEIFIHANKGKFIAFVEKRYPNYAAAEADYELSFQTITENGPLYDYHAPHYLCRLANPDKSPVGACETDCKLKARHQD